MAFKSKTNSTMPDILLHSPARAHGVSYTVICNILHTFFFINCFRVNGLFSIINDAELVELEDESALLSFWQVLV